MPFNRFSNSDGINKIIFLLILIPIILLAVFVALPIFIVIVFIVICIMLLTGRKLKFNKHYTTFNKFRKKSTQQTKTNKAQDTGNKDYVDVDFKNVDNSQK
jgi:predicted membrane protein